MPSRLSLEETSRSADPTCPAVFMRLGLVDEYRIYVHPVLIGAGKPLFQTSDATVNLELIETRRFGNGVVLLRYRQT